MQPETEVKQLKSLPQRLKDLEEDFTRRGVLFPVSIIQATLLLVPIVRYNEAMRLIKWSKRNKMIIPKAEKRGGSRVDCYDLDHLLIFAQTAVILKEELSGDINPEDLRFNILARPENVLAKLKTSLEGTRLESLLPTSLSTISSNQNEALQLEEPISSKQKFDRPPVSSSELAEMGDLTLKQLIFLRRESERWVKNKPLIRDRIVLYFRSMGFSFNHKLADTFVFLTGVRLNKPASYSDCTQGDFDQTLMWCIEEMEENKRFSLTLSGIVRIIEDKLSKLQPKV